MKIINFFCIAVTFSMTFFARSIDKANIHYVLSKYQHKIFNRECLFYPAKDPKRLLIFFTGLRKNVYIMWSWFWRDQEDWQDTAYLFIKDDDGCWYLGKDKESFVEDYISIINHFILLCNLPKEKVFTIGGSMGGYAAIFYATVLGLKAAIAINPQVNKKSWLLREFDDIGDQWKELENIVASCQKTPDLSLIYSYDPRDQSAGYDLLNVMKEKGSLIILRRHNSFQHTGAAHLTKEFVEMEIAYFEKQGLYCPIKSLLNKEKN